MCMLLIQLLIPPSENLEDLRIHFEDVHCCAISNSKSWKQSNIRVRDQLHKLGHTHCILHGENRRRIFTDIGKLWATSWEWWWLTKQHACCNYIFVYKLHFKMMGKTSMKMVTMPFPDGGVANKWFTFLSFGLYFLKCLQLSCITYE